MAEEIKFVFTADTTELQSSKKIVQELGLAAEKDVVSFEKLDKTVRENLQKSLGGTTVTAKQFNEAIKKAATEGEKAVKKTGDEVEKTGKRTKKVADDTKKSTEATGKQYETLAQQIRKARAAAASFDDQNSAGAIAAQKNLSDLIDKQADLNARQQALNKDAPLLAFSQLAQSGIAGLQGLTGALQLFGIENERINDIAQRLQGFLNLTQGINSIAALGDTLSNLKAILTVTTAAQGSLAVATEAEAAAATKGAAANTAFAASLSATGIGAIAVALGAIIGVFIAIANSSDEATDSVKKFAAASEEADQAFSDILRNALDADGVRLKNLERQLDYLQGTGALESQILQTKLDILEAEVVIEGNIRNGLRSKQEQAKQDQKLYDLINDRLILQHRLTKAVLEEEEARRKLLTQDTPDYIGRNPNKIRADVKELGDVIGVELEQLNKDIPPLNIPLGITDEDLAQAESAIQNIADLTQGFFEISRNLSQNETDARIDDLERQRDAGVLTQKQYSEQVRAIRRDQAQKEKAQALFTGGLGVAVAIINALRTPPAPNLPAAALAAALGGLQLGAIASRPVPRFKKGRLPQVPGVYTGSNEDSHLGWFSPEEAIIPPLQTREYFPVLDALYNRKIPSKVFNAFAQGQSKTSISASINPYDMRHAIDGSGFKLKNVNQLADAIATRMPKPSKVSQRRLWQE
jgi:hypothetical protein